MVFISEMDSPTEYLKNLSQFSKLLKRVFDILFSSIALVLLSPFLILIAFLIKVADGGPIIFKQKRPGVFLCESLIFTSLELCKKIKT